MTRLSRTAPLLALALLLGAGSAAAQTIPSPYRHVEPGQGIGAFAGYLFLSPDINVTDTSSVPIGLRSAPVAGVRYEARVSPPLSFRGSLSVSPSSRDLWAPGLGQDSLTISPEPLGVSVPATLVALEAGFRLGLTGPRTWNGLAPFTTASAGVVADVRGTFAEEEELAEDEVFRLGPTFAMGASVGTDWFPAPRTSLRVELQGLLWRVTTPSGFAPLRATRQTEWNPGVGVTVGAAIHF